MSNAAYSVIWIRFHCIGKCPGVLGSQGANFLVSRSQSVRLDRSSFGVDCSGTIDTSL